MRARGLKRRPQPPAKKPKLVAPHAGAWIETLLGGRRDRRIRVAPHAGAWIETNQPCESVAYCRVAPHAGAWIETQAGRNRTRLSMVAPLAGEWIETSSPPRSHSSISVALAGTAQQDRVKPGIDSLLRDLMH